MFCGERGAASILIFDHGHVQLMLRASLARVHVDCRSRFLGLSIHAVPHTPITVGPDHSK